MNPPDRTNDPFEWIPATRSRTLCRSLHARIQTNLEAFTVTERANANNVLDLDSVDLVSSSTDATGST